MKIIKRVTQFPLRAQPEGDMAFNINTKQLRVYKDNAGNYTDYDSFYVSPDVDTLGINGFYPLYRTKALADAASPLGTSHEHDASDLGIAPDGVDYPLYMPNGLSTNQHGTYIDPVGDDDGDGVPNFRDPDIIGLTALPSAGIKSGSGLTDGYNTPISYDDQGNQTGGVNVAASDITDQISNPGAGSYNDTGNTITINGTGPGVLIKAAGSVIKFNLNDSVDIEPGDTFIYQGGMTGSGSSSLGNAGGDSAGYTGSGNFQTSNGSTVDVENQLIGQLDGTIDTGTTNNTGSNIIKSFTGTGIVVAPDGTVTNVTSPATIPDGSILFVKSGGGNDNTHWDGTTTPITLPGGNSVDLTGKLELDGDGNGVINNTTSSSSHSFTGSGFLVSPQGSITGPVTSPVQIPPGYAFFSGTETSSGGYSGGGSSTGTDAGLTVDGSGNISVPDGSGGTTDININLAFSGTGTGNLDSGTTNNTVDNITNTLGSNEVGVVIDGSGGVGSKQTGGITYGPGETLIVKTINVQTSGDGTPDSPLIKSIYGGDPASLQANDGTKFTSDTLLGFVDEFFTYDFGTATEVTGLTLTDFSFSKGPASAIVQSSDDGETWTGGMVGVSTTTLSGSWPDNSSVGGEDITSYSGSVANNHNYVQGTSHAISSNRIAVDSIPKTIQIGFAPFTARYVRLIFWQFGSNGEFEIDQVQFATTPSSGGSSGGTSGGSSSNDANFTVSDVLSDAQPGMAAATVSGLSNLLVNSYGTGAANYGLALKLSWNSNDEFFRYTANPNPGSIDHFLILRETNQTIKFAHNNDQVPVLGESTITLEGSDGSIYTYDFSSNPNGLSYSSALTLTPQ